MHWYYEMPPINDLQGAPSTICDLLIYIGYFCPNKYFTIASTS